MPTSPFEFEYGEYIDRVGIEIEGGWTRFESTGCSHTCREGSCRRKICTHRCGEDCLSPRCNHDCVDHEGRACTHRCGSASCYIKACVHRCTMPQYSDRSSATACYSACIHECVSIGCPTGNVLVNYHHDGSVNSTLGTITGECVSNPCSTKEEFANFVKTYYPDRVNNSCGTHFHVSVLRDEDYTRLMSPEFYTYFKYKLIKWAREVFDETHSAFWSRVAGQNRYCCPNDLVECFHGRNVHDVKKQAEVTSKSDCRYAHINFCKKLRGTIEFRIFHGISDPNIMIRAIDFITATMCSYIHEKRTESYYDNRMKIRELIQSIPCTVTVIDSNLDFAKVETPAGEVPKPDKTKKRGGRRKKSTPEELLEQMSTPPEIIEAPIVEEREIAAVSTQNTGANMNIFTEYSSSPSRETFAEFCTRRELEERLNQVDRDQEYAYAGDLSDDYEFSDDDDF